MSKKKNRSSDTAQRAVCNHPLEALEGRQLLSTAFIEAGGRLVVRGTAGNDHVNISINPQDKSEVRVLLNGQSFDFASKYVKQVKVEAGAGNDLVQADTNNGAVNASMFFLGDAGSDTLVTSTGGDCLIGGGENDVLLATTGNNYLDGGYGNDKLYAGVGNDTMVGEGGDDHLQDAGGQNSIVGAARGDVVVTAPLPTSIPTAGGSTTPVQQPVQQTPAPTPTPIKPNPTPTPTPTPTPGNSASPFVIGVWSQPTYSFSKWKARGINTMVGYEGLSGTVSVEKFSDEAVKSGLFMIRHPNADPTRDKGQKNLLAWMENDEPDYHNTDPKVLAAQYATLKKVDPNKPVFVNLSGASALWGYGSTSQATYKQYLSDADWISNDLYPITAHNRPTALDAPGQASALLSQWSGGKRQFAVIEASDQQLSGREHAYPGVNPDQFRAEVFNAVISGVTGIIYFPQRIGDGFLFDAMNPQVEAEMKSVDARLARIGPALMTQKDPSGVGIDVDGNLRATWRKYNGKTYLVVLNNSTQAASATMDIHGTTAPAAAVDGENRTVAIRNGQITDSFKPYEAHVYVV